MYFGYLFTYEIKYKLCLKLYNQDKNVREIAQEARMSFRDIGAILKKVEDFTNSGNGNTLANDKGNNSNKSTIEKATQAHRLFEEGIKLCRCHNISFLSVCS